MHIYTYENDNTENEPYLGSFTMHKKGYSSKKLK